MRVAKNLKTKQDVIEYPIHTTFEPNYSITLEDWILESDEDRNERLKENKK